MKRTIIACGMMKNDLLNIINHLPYEAEIIWLDDKLHNVPKDLNKKLQEAIDEHQDADEIILVYLLCGNALIGLSSSHASLRFIKGDDCIYACLCEREDYMNLRTTSFFVSHGWLSTDRNIVSEYERCVDKYGEEMAEYIYDSMYRNYKYLVFMQTDENSGPNEKELEDMEKLAKLSKVEIKNVNGSLDLFKKLLYLEKDEKIITIEPGHIISPSDF